MSASPQQLYRMATHRLIAAHATDGHKAIWHDEGPTCVRVAELWNHGAYLQVYLYRPRIGAKRSRAFHRMQKLQRDAIGILEIRGSEVKVRDYSAAVSLLYWLYMPIVRRCSKEGIST